MLDTIVIIQFVRSLFFTIGPTFFVIRGCKLWQQLKLLMMKNSDNSGGQRFTVCFLVHLKQNIHLNGGSFHCQLLFNIYDICLIIPVKS